MSVLSPDTTKGRKTGNRWYDKRPHVARSIALLEALPPVIQNIIASGVVEIANREFDAGELLNSYKSLGTEKILGLHKSKNKMRKLDANPDTHKAVTYLYVLSEENQDFMAQQIIELVEFIGQYLRQCSTYRQTPDEKDVGALTEHYVTQGKSQAHSFLQQLENRFKQSLNNPAAVASQPVEGKEDILEDTRGMRIRD